MSVVDDSEFFTREALAGYDREILERAEVAIVGAGAAGNNIGLDLALAGLGTLRDVDFDTVEPSNLTRSPLFDRRRIGGSRTRSKAHELALGFLANAYAREPRVRYSLSRVEALGYAAFAGCGAVVACVDSLSVRAYLADVTRRLGIPLIEVGFSAPRGHVSVFPNARADEPCWRCQHPHVEHGHVSCSLFAEQVTSEGRIAATQSVAATVAGLATEAVLMALHGEFPMANRVLQLDVRTGRSSTFEIAPDPMCPGVHARFGEITDIGVTVDETARVLLDRAREIVAEPILHLPAPYVVEMPCVRCGASVHVGRPAWQLREASSCRKCPDVPHIGATGPLTVHTLRVSDVLCSTKLRRLGIAPGTIIDIEDGTTGTVRAARVAGGVGDLFRDLALGARNTGDAFRGADPSEENS